MGVCPFLNPVVVSLRSSERGLKFATGIGNKRLFLSLRSSERGLKCQITGSLYCVNSRSVRRSVD